MIFDQHFLYIIIHAKLFTARHKLWWLWKQYEVFYIEWSVSIKIYCLKKSNEIIKQSKFTLARKKQFAPYTNSHSCNVLKEFVLKMWDFKTSLFSVSGEEYLIQRTNENEIKNKLLFGKSDSMHSFCTRIHGSEEICSLDKGHGSHKHNKTKTINLNVLDRW